jgi:GGDEF domain-containing protein
MIRTATSLPFGARATRGSWLLGARTDPITGLVAFPDFHRRFPKVLGRSMRRGEPVVVAIGDVDNLKAYVEDTNQRSETSFGHLAGNALMTQLGREARSWLAETGLRRAALSTFGGDEIIFAAAVSAPTAARAHVEQLRDHLRACLPRTVSFAYMHCAATDDPSADRYLATIAKVDRTLFTAKHDHDSRGGLVVEAEAPGSGTRHGRIAEIGSSAVIMLDNGTSDDLIRGRRYRVTVGDHAFVAVAHETNGRQVLRLDDGAGAGLPTGATVAVHLDLLADRGPLHVPKELESALAAAGVTMDVLSEGERRQFVMFVREGRAPEVRRQRVADVVRAVKEHA